MKSGDIVRHRSNYGTFTVKVVSLGRFTVVEVDDILFCSDFYVWGIDQEM